MKLHCTDGSTRQEEGGKSGRTGEKEKEKKLLPFCSTQVVQFKPVMGLYPHSGAFLSANITSKNSRCFCQTTRAGASEKVVLGGEKPAHCICCLQLNSAHSSTFTKKGSCWTYPKIYLQKITYLGEEPNHNRLQKGKAQCTHSRLIAASWGQTSLPKSTGRCPGPGKGRKCR